MSSPASPRRRTVIGGATLVAVTILWRRGLAEEPALLRIGGTGMALATVRRLGEAFVEQAPGVDIRVLPSLGTGGGLSALAAGAIEFALSARPLNDAERSRGLHSVAYANTPIAFVTHPDTGIHAVTLQEVADILAGRMQKWPSGKPVRLVRREPSDADWALLRGLSPDMEAAVRSALERPGLLTVATDQDNADALERLSGSFGAMSLGQIRAEARQVIPLRLDDAAPTVEGLADGRYRLSRTLRIVWRDPPGPDAVRFLAYLQGRAAAGILTRLGHIPVAASGA